MLDLVLSGRRSSTGTVTCTFLCSLPRFCNEFPSRKGIEKYIHCRPVIMKWNDTREREMIFSSMHFVSSALPASSLLQLTSTCQLVRWPLIIYLIVLLLKFDWQVKDSLSQFPVILLIHVLMMTSMLTITFSFR